MSSRGPVALLLLVVAAACGDDDVALPADGSVAELDGAADAAVDATVAIDAMPSDALDSAARYFGRVLYEDRPQDADGFTGEVETVGAPGVLVELLGDAGETLEATRTDAEGLFAFAATTGAITVRAWADTEHMGHRAVVTNRDRWPARYAMTAPARSGSATELLASADYLGGPFNVVAVSWSAFVVYAPLAEAAPPLSYRWEAARAFACGSCYDSDSISLGGGLDDTDEYDDLIVLHELAHYFVDRHSADSSPGGSHRDRQVEPTLAYGEGIAYAFAAVIRQDPLILDTYADAIRTIDLEAVTLGGAALADFQGTSDGTRTGALREEIIAAIAWDAFDEASAVEPFDRVALGRDRWLELLVDHFGGPVPDAGARGIDLTDFLNALVCVSGVPAVDVAALAEDRAFPWTAPSC